MSLDTIIFWSAVWIAGGVATAYANRKWEDFFVWPLFVVRKVYRRAVHLLRGGD